MERRYIQQQTEAGFLVTVRVGKRDVPVCLADYNLAMAQIVLLGEKVIE